MKTIMKFIICALFLSSALAFDFKSLPLPTATYRVSLDEKVCPKGTHGSDCDKNSKHCKNYNSKTLECEECDFQYEIKKDDVNGDYCKQTVWFYWFWAGISFLGTSGIVLVSVCVCCICI